MKEVDPGSPRTQLTMTVAELIRVLHEYDPHLPVIATWEGVGAGVRRENFTVAERKGRQELLIDVEDYG